MTDREYWAKVAEDARKALCRDVVAPKPKGKFKTHVQLWYSCRGCGLQGWEFLERGKVRPLPCPRCQKPRMDKGMWNNPHRKIKDNAVGQG